MKAVAASVSLCQLEGTNQFRIAVHCDKAVLISNIFPVLIRSHGLLMLPYVAPDFVNVKVLDLEAIHCLMHEFPGLFSYPH